MLPMRAGFYLALALSHFNTPLSAKNQAYDYYRYVHELT